MSTHKSAHNFFEKYTAAILIFLLFVSQTIHVSFFDRADATLADYRDIVSVFVDRETYADLRTEIRQYADDIAGYLKMTRVSIFVVPSWTRSEAIASQNEKLYYEWDGRSGVSQLVGTVLIGNVPIPMVTKDGTTFPSLYPYVDFDKKRFVYDERSHRYVFQTDVLESSEVDIWHGVINPSLGSVWQWGSDIRKIKAFLDKTHEFYTGQAKFAPTNIPPRVFYYDGYNESLSVDPRSFQKYVLFSQNLENIAYRRWSKYFLSDIIRVLSEWQLAHADEEDALLSDILRSSWAIIGDESIDPETLAQIPDIQTEKPIMSYLKRFHEMVNQKTLSDIQGFVHNAGRYNSGITVRVDQGAVDMTYTDEMAQSVLKSANDALENAIDLQMASGGYIRPIVLFDEYKKSYYPGPYVTSQPLRTMIYQNYFFGREARTITSSDQCTIARGATGAVSSFGRDILVEANAAYDISSTLWHANTLSGDTQELISIFQNSAYACFSPDGLPKLDPLYGKNSILRISSLDIPAEQYFFTSPSGTNFKNFASPVLTQTGIFSLGGMKETERISAPSIADCLGSTYQYTLLQPSLYNYIEYSCGGMDISCATNCRWAYPEEWNRPSGFCPKVSQTNTPRFTCLTAHQNGIVETNLPGAIATYGNCTYWLIQINNQFLSQAGDISQTPTYYGNKCIIPGFCNDSECTFDRDNTIYKDEKYHTIPSLLHHTSPTDTEIEAAKENRLTPSLPINTFRSAEFLTPKSGIAKITYPNFFSPDMPYDSISSVRNWIKGQNDAQWWSIISAESGKSLSSFDAHLNTSLGVTELPSIAPDWNTLLSDEMIMKIIMTRKYLAKGVTEKYAHRLQASLSYSQKFDPLDTLKNPLTLPGRNGYDIAYLGLSPFVPWGEEQTDDNALDAEYRYRLGELRWVNFSEVNNPELSDPEKRESAQCGPPEWVPLFQWLPAIMCWIKTLLPVKISPGACGSSSIGIDDMSHAITVAPPVAISRSGALLREYYGQGRLVYQIERTTMMPDDTLPVNYILIRDGAKVDIPPTAQVVLTLSWLTSGTENIPISRAREFLSLATSEASYGEKWSPFLISTQNKLSTAFFTSKIRIPLPDGTVFEKEGDPLTIRVTDEYVDVTPVLDEVPVAHVSTTQTGNLEIVFATKKQSTGATLPAVPPYTISLYDDVTKNLIQSGITVTWDHYTFPENYRNALGVYRIVAIDREGRYGETTLAVRSGPVAAIEFYPISSALARGSSSFGVLRFTDQKGNIASPDLLHLSLRADGGQWVNPDGTKVSTRTHDVVESEMLLSYTAGEGSDMRMTFSLDQPDITLTKTISLIENPRVRIIRSATPIVWGDPIDMRIELVDAGGNVLSGFSSIANIQISAGAGTFSTTNLPLQNGRTQNFTFTPGRVSGDHILRIDIPWIGATSERRFDILAGEPMYIDGNVTDREIQFSLRDRYGNLSPANMDGTLQYNTDNMGAIHFENGRLTRPRQSGYWVVNVPDIESNSLTYTDTSSVQTVTDTTTSAVTTPLETKVIRWIPFYHLYVQDVPVRFSFLPDYNARYTVLAGESYLREGSQILYDTLPWQSQSLAVSTLLSSPYDRESLFTILPWWGYTLSDAIDTALEANLSSHMDTLVLDLQDTASDTPIASIAYPMRNLDISACSATSELSDECRGTDEAGVEFVTFRDSDYRLEQPDANSMSLVQDTNALFTYRKDTGLWLAPGVELVPRNDLSMWRLVADITYEDSVIARMILHLPEDVSVDVGDTASSVTRLTLDSRHAYYRTPAYGSVFLPDIQWYSIEKNRSSTTLDERVLWPSWLESFGALREVPGVGWHTNNRSLLSFAAGDTVWESTRWYHTYTLVNLGDPVAHVDRGAVGTESEWLDRSVGTQVAGSAENSLLSYKHRDMNGDGYEDLVVVKSDGFLELYLNFGGVFRKKEKIAFIPNMPLGGIELGDFVGDHYADILSLDQSWSLILIDNSGRRLREKNIIITDGQGNPRGITQYRIYDMDADGRDDIVYLTEWGELGILYGTATVGTFERVILDGALGVFLSGNPEKWWGAVRASTTPITPLANTTGTGQNEMVLNDQVFYQYRGTTTMPTDSMTTQDIVTIGAVFSGASTDPNTRPSYGSTGELYVKSEYAEAYGLQIEKRYRNLSSTSLHEWDRVQISIALKNTSTGTITGVKYLDRMPKIFTLPRGAKYKALLGTMSSEDVLDPLSVEEYDFLLRGFDIPAGETLTFTYEVQALRVRYGKMIVDNLERGLIGDDSYGDVGFEASTTCGADMLVWSSDTARTYTRGTRSFGTAELPSELAGKITDVNRNGVPDSMENMSTGALQDAYASMRSPTVAQKPLVQVNTQQNGRLIDIDLSDGAEADIEASMKAIADGLSCGFGWGGCMSFPINWAPLAPWNALSVLGNPVGRKPAPNQWLPLFSALTRLDIGQSPYCFTVPFIWPVTPMSLDAKAECSSANVWVAWMQAVAQFPSIFVGSSTASDFISGGWVIGTESKQNFLRIFVTPTLTMAMWSAICLGTAKGSKNEMYPLLSKWNCIIITKPRPVCKWDGSRDDGDVRVISWLGTTRTSWNGKSCWLSAMTLTPIENATLTEDIIRYLKSPRPTDLDKIYPAMTRRSSVSLPTGPMIQLGSPTANAGDSTIEISVDSAKPLKVNNIIKVNNTRISGFPEFIMEWVGRQKEEMSNKLLTLPNISVILPSTVWTNAHVNYGDLNNYSADFSKDSLQKLRDEFWAQVGKNMSQIKDRAFAQIESIPWNAENVYNNTDVTRQLSWLSSSKTPLSAPYKSWIDEKMKENAKTINSAAGGVSAMRSIYQLLGKIPFLQVEQVSIPINIPWILPQEFDKYAYGYQNYKQKINTALSDWCVGKTAQQCIDAKTSSNISSVQSRIDQNLRRIEEWKRLPEKLQKYVTWKQRYITQILCNVDAIEAMTSRWYSDNAIRFKKWAEFYVLMKTIIASWQPFIDIWMEKDRQCSVCQNQRWDLKYWKFKMLSAVIPKFPILQFPRWPDIVLDLSDIRFAIMIRVPDFRFRLNPIRLPSLPSFSLPTGSLSFTFPDIGVIPPPPNLPDLPDLPSLPRINLPNLPPPPKLPKLFWAVSAALKIFKLYQKIQCYMEKTFLVPEDYAGATIAQRTDRQGTFPFDFLSKMTPQFGIDWGIPREIRVSSHVNFELRTDFIVEFAKAAVKPINNFSADLARGMPKKLVPDVNIQWPGNINIRPSSYVPSSRKDVIGKIPEPDELLDVPDFSQYLRSEMLAAWMDVKKFDQMMRITHTDADTLTRNMQENQSKSYALLRQYLEAEQAETKSLEKWIDSLSRPDTVLALTGAPLAEYVSNTWEKASTRILEKYSVMSAKAISASRRTDLWAEKLISSISRQMHRLAVDATPPLSPPESVDANLAPGYTPNFQGIYVLSPVTRSQTRLFDYTALLDGSETADLVDFDRDGDMDYLYMIWGNLYVKYAFSKKERPIDTTVVIDNLDADIRPKAPNFFFEQRASPGEMEVSWSPARLSDDAFRLEFFDRYLEWDTVKIDGHDDTNTPRTIIDFTVSPTLSGGESVTPVLRSLEDVSVSSGFVLEGMKSSILPTGSDFSLSSGRAIYTGNGAASLNYVDPTTGETRTKNLERFQRYTFSESLSGIITTGKVYVLTPSVSERIEYTDDMRGMPLLPGVRLMSTIGEVRVYDPLMRTSLSIRPWVEYRHIGIGQRQSRYQLSFPYPNGFYSARMTSLTSGSEIHAGITLIAPQASLDHSPPFLDVPSEIRIPVYQTQTLNLRDIITEMSNYTLRVDPDTTIDSDSDGIFDNDFLTNGSGVSVGQEGLTIGPFDTLGLRTMNIRVQDQFGNTSTQEMRVVVYAPIPTITQASVHGTLSGELDEKIEREPIHVFRVREWNGISLIDPRAAITDTEGYFHNNTLTGSVSIQLSGDVGNLNISPYTGIPISGGYVTRVIPATASTPLRLDVRDGGVRLYTVDVVAPTDTRITDTQTMTWASVIRVNTLASSIQVVSASLTDPSIPWGMYIVGENAAPYVAIDRRWQIYALDTTVAMSASEQNGKLEISIRKEGAEIARIRYDIDLFITGK